MLFTSARPERIKHSAADHDVTGLRWLRKMGDPDRPLGKGHPHVQRPDTAERQFAARLLKRQPCRDGADGCLRRVRFRRPGRRDRIAGKLQDPPAFGLDGVGHAREHGIDDAAQFFRAAILGPGKLRGSGEILRKVAAMAKNDTGRERRDQALQRVRPVFAAVH